MQGKILRIHWHGKQPVFAVDFDPRDTQHFVTCGGDGKVRVRDFQNSLDVVVMLRVHGQIWRLVPGQETTTSIDGVTAQYCATLNRHVKSANCVRFAPSGIWQEMWR